MAQLRPDGTAAEGGSMRKSLEGTMVKMVPMELLVGQRLIRHWNIGIMHATYIPLVENDVINLQGFLRLAAR
jgi:hypothetical protein